MKSIKKNYIIASIKKWDLSNFEKYYSSNPHFFLVTEKNQLTPQFISKIKPRYIFFPHWSWIIPKPIWNHYECIVFHMTDLPFGRGGTPLQNLIIRQHTKTIISALRVEKGLDTGPLYVKRRLSLNGTAEQIYKRASRSIFSKIIPLIFSVNPTLRYLL